MKKQVLMLAAIIAIVFFVCVKNDNMKKIESFSIITEDAISTTDPLAIYRITVSEYSQELSVSPDNRWKTYLHPD